MVSTVCVYNSGLGRDCISLKIIQNLLMFKSWDNYSELMALWSACILTAPHCGSLRDPVR